MKVSLNKVKPTVSQCINKRSIQVAKKQKKNIIVADKYPGWLGLPGENYGNTVGRKIAFYPEDMKKMKSMTKDEAWSYEAQLIAKHRYYYDNRPIKHSKEFIQFIKDNNIDMSKFIVK